VERQSRIGITAPNTIESLKALDQNDPNDSKRPTPNAPTITPGKLVRPANTAATKPDQKTGVVVERGRRRNQDPGQRADGGSENEACLACSLARQADDAGSQPIYRRRAQRHSRKRVSKKPEQQDDQQERGAKNNERLTTDRHGTQLQRIVQERGRPVPFGTEEDQAKSNQSKVHAYRDDQQGQDAGVRD
jgi:hypothetical protein